MPSATGLYCMFCKVASLVTVFGLLMSVFAAQPAPSPEHENVTEEPNGKEIY